MGGVALTAATGYFIYLQTRAIEYEPSSSQKLFSSLINPLAPSRASRYFSVSGKVAPSGSQLVVDESALRAILAEIVHEYDINGNKLTGLIPESHSSNDSKSITSQNENDNDDEDLDFLRSHVGAKCIAGLQRSDAVPAWPALLPCRKFITGGNGFAGSPTSTVSETDFSVFSMNVLADGLAGLADGFSGFTHLPLEGLQWSNRKYRIMDEILTRNPDVVCLQEVDHFHDWFEPQLSKIGYAGVYREDPFSPCLKTGSGLCDGVAVFYRRNKLDMIALESLHMSSTHIRKEGKDKGTEAGIVETH
eukprot:UC4_evm4s1434